MNDLFNGLETTGRTSTRQWNLLILPIEGLRQSLIPRGSLSNLKRTLFDCHTTWACLIWMPSLLVLQNLTIIPTPNRFQAASWMLLRTMIRLTPFFSWRSISWALWVSGIRTYPPSKLQVDSGLPYVDISRFYLNLALLRIVRSLCFGIATICCGCKALTWTIQSASRGRTWNVAGMMQSPFWHDVAGIV